MKNLAALVLAIIVGTTVANSQTSLRVYNGGSVENVYSQFEKLLKDSLNPNIKFDSTLANETMAWLELAIEGKSKGAVTGHAHFYSKIENDKGLNLPGIIELTDKNVDRIKTGDHVYRFATEDGLPTSFYMTTLERDGITYFAYALD